jgi:PqqD family protein of HPr-rel-A system
VTASSQPQWQITRGCDLLWRGWDGEQVVFNTGSGDTHLLDLVSSEILKKLESAPASRINLETRIRSLAAANSLEIPAGYMEGLLEKLQSLALVEPVNP